MAGKDDHRVAPQDVGPQPAELDIGHVLGRQAMLSHPEPECLLAARAGRAAGEARLEPTGLERAQQRYDRPQRMRVPRVQLAVPIQVGPVVGPPGQIRVDDERSPVRRLVQRTVGLMHDEREVRHHRPAPDPQQPEPAGDLRHAVLNPSRPVHDECAHTRRLGPAVVRHVERERTRTIGREHDGHRGPDRDRRCPRDVRRQDPEMREHARRGAEAADGAARLQDVRLLRLRVAVGVLAVPGQRRGVGVLLSA